MQKNRIYGIKLIRRTKMSRNFIVTVAVLVLFGAWMSFWSCNHERTTNGYNYRTIVPQNIEDENAPIREEKFDPNFERC